MDVDLTSKEPSAMERAPWQFMPTEELHDYVVEHIDEAVEQGWIVPYYQPVVRTITGHLCSMEALARWEDPELGLLPPFVFIPALEEARLVHKLDICIIERVARQYRECIDEGLPVVPVSVNLSRLDFDLCNVFEVVENTLHHYEMPTNMLNIEITESVLGDDPEFMRERVREFHDAGHQVWMDDFGSGYSTLNVLKDFDFDELKIDLVFLRHFSEKAKTIIASVVNMAKHLGIQTLAEGVETPEHAEFLRQIGCERQQGYLYGRPHPFDFDYNRAMMRRLGMDPLGDRYYLIAQGRVNMVGLSASDFLPDNMESDYPSYLTRLPLVLVEYDGSRIRIIEHNEPFERLLDDVGIEGMEGLARLVNDPKQRLWNILRHHMNNIRVTQFARCDYTLRGQERTIRMKFVAAHRNRTTVLMTVDSADDLRERERRDRMSAAASVLYSIYEHIDIIHVDEGYGEPVFSNAPYAAVYRDMSIEETVRVFAEAELYQPDRRRYIEYMDMSTVMQRLEENGSGYLVNFFRVRSGRGDFTWKLFGLIAVESAPDNQVMLCIRDTNWVNDGVFQQVYSTEDDEDMHRELREADLAVTDGSLWRALQMDTDIGFFWKGTDRRFIGASDALLSFFNLKSVKDIRGKTNEEIGWLVDSDSAWAEEERILKHGEAVKGSLYQVITNGQVVDVMVAKQPIYRNGVIVGLLGYFMDVSLWQEAFSPAAEMTLIDAVTGVLNYSGSEAALSNYVDAYVKHNTDFAMVCLDIDRFKRINDVYGYEFGDKVLRRVADVLRDEMGSTCVVGHVYADRFIIIMQETRREKIMAACERIEQRLHVLPDIEDGASVSLFAVMDYVLYSEVEDAEDLKTLVHARVQARKEQIHSVNQQE